MVRALTRCLLLIFALAQLGTTCQGTETGNPGGPTGEQPPEDGETADPSPPTGQSEIDELIDLLCQRVDECQNTASAETCVESLNGPDGDNLGDDFGLPEGEFTVEEIRAGLEDGSIVTDDAALAECEADLASIPCNQAEANVAADDFSHVENFVPDSCLGVFSLN